MTREPHTAATGFCDKCGFGAGATVTYRSFAATFGGAVLDEWLGIECKVCGYVYEMECKS